MTVFSYHPDVKPVEKIGLEMPHLGGVFYAAATTQRLFFEGWSYRIRFPSFRHEEWNGEDWGYGRSHHTENDYERSFIRVACQLTLKGKNEVNGNIEGDSPGTFYTDAFGQVYVKATDGVLHCLTSGRTGRHQDVIHNYEFAEMNFHVIDRFPGEP